MNPMSPTQLTEQTEDHFASFLAAPEAKLPILLKLIPELRLYLIDPHFGNLIAVMRDRKIVPIQFRY